MNISLVLEILNISNKIKNSLRLPGERQKITVLTPIQSGGFRRSVHWGALIPAWGMKIYQGKECDRQR